MKKILLIFLFLIPILVTYAQQPAPKTPKDPDADMVAPPIADTTPHGNVYSAVEHEPTFPGGIEKLYAYLTKNLVYPRVAKENNIQGRVFVTFVVEKDGSLTGIQIKKGLSPECDAEAIRLVQNLPKWIPGIQNSRAVRVQYTLPVLFVITD